MKLTRRELAGIVAGTPAAARGAGSVLTSQAPGDAPVSPEQSAIEDARKAVAGVRKFKVPIEAEPAFTFRAQ
jgi:hypothetical protein